jgi:hypothetical protein
MGGASELVWTHRLERKYPLPLPGIEPDCKGNDGKIKESIFITVIRI